MAKLVGLLVVVLALVGASSRASDSWAKLRRPLHIPHIAAGVRCPVAVATHPSPYGVSLGRGPAYPLTAWRVGTLSFLYPVRPSQQDWYPSDWSGQKVIWIVAPRYRGPLLIRGRQLDGPNLLRFDDGSLPSAELQIPAGGTTSSGGFREGGGYTRLRAPGCYGWQVDGTTFSRVIVFRAVVIRP